MNFYETPLPGAWVIGLDPLSDERGWFARSFDADEFRARGLDLEIVQCNISVNTRRDTLRGLHYQVAPHAETKLVRCLHGRIFDVALDLRSDSPTYRQWHAVELGAEDRCAFYIPRGMAHGFQTLTDNSEVHYLMGHRYVPEASRGVRWDDPAFAIAWPQVAGERVISDRDASYRDFQPDRR